MPKHEMIMRDTMGDMVYVNSPEGQASIKRGAERKKAEKKKLQEEMDRLTAGGGRPEDEGLTPDQKRLNEITRERDLLNRKLKNPKMYMTALDMGNPEAVAKQIQVFEKGLMDQLKYLDHEEVRLREKMEQAGS